MKLDLELLFTNLSRTEDDTGIPRDGVNDYLIDRILLPCMNGEGVRLTDINFNAFEEEDIGTLEAFYNKMQTPVYELQKVVAAMSTVSPVAANARGFC